MPALLQFLQFLPVALLLASGLLEIFVVSRRDSDAEPGVLWLLFCTVMAAGMAAVPAFVEFFWKGNHAALQQGYLAIALAVVASTAWYLKRQGRNRGLLLLNEKFRSGNPAAALCRKPGQILWVLGYRCVFLISLTVAAGLLLTPPAVPVSGQDWASTSNGPADPSGPPQQEFHPPAPVAGKPAIGPLVDPTRAEIPSAELSAMAAMATASMTRIPSIADPHSGPGRESQSILPPSMEQSSGDSPSVPVVAVPAVAARPVSRNSTYFSKVRPILRRYCVSCHGPDKQKGDLRLDSPDALRMGVNGKPVIVPGNPAKSRIAIVIGLPSDDDDHMPPKGSPVSISERALLTAWIGSGADLGDGVSIPAGHDGVFLVDSIAETLPAPDPKIIEILAAAHVVIRPLSKNGHLLELDFSHSDRARGDLQLAALEPMALNIFALDFSRTSIRDADLSFLAPMKNLNRLLLSRTSISDSGLALLSGSDSLEHLNLYSTSVTDAGLATIAELKSLKKIYLWQSKVTPAGVKTLQSQVLGLTVSNGE